MKISTKGRYALRLMMDVASHDDAGYVSLKDVAARQNISMKYLEQIAGLLAKEPENYTVGSILRLTEGDLAPVACLAGEENRCERCGECPTLDFWTGLYATVNAYIDRYTLADLLEEQKRKQGKT